MLSALEQTALGFLDRKDVVDTGAFVLAARFGDERNKRLCSLPIQESGKWIVWSTAAWGTVLRLMAERRLWGEAKVGHETNDAGEHPVLVYCPKDAVAEAARILRENGVNEAMVWKPDTSTRDGVHTPDGDMFAVPAGSSTPIRNPGFTGRNVFP